MSWREVAIKDVHDASRSRVLWLLGGFLTALLCGYAFVHEHLGDPTFTAFLDGVVGLIAVVLPVVGILLGYKSVIHERTSGSLFLSLSFPHSRRDVIVGTFLGRTVVLLAPTLVALGIAGVIGAVRFGTDGMALYPGFMGVTALYGMAFVGFAVGLSAVTTRERWITFGAFGGYLLVVNFWGGVHSLTLLVLHRFRGSVLLDVPDWSLLFRLASPAESYYRLVRAVADLDRAAVYVGSDVPFYVGWWAAVLVLVVWAVVPLLAGYWRFRDTDL